MADAVDVQEVVGFAGVAQGVVDLQADVKRRAAAHRKVVAHVERQVRVGQVGDLLLGALGAAVGAGHAVFQGVDAGRVAVGFARGWAGTGPDFRAGIVDVPRDLVVAQVGGDQLGDHQVKGGRTVALLKAGQGVQVGEGGLGHRHRLGDARGAACGGFDGEPHRLVGGT